MGYKHPKPTMHANGVWGGVGTRPADEAWTPGGGTSSEADRPERVPRRWRRLRLRRTRHRPMVSSDNSGWPALLFVVVFVLVFGLALFAGVFK